MARTQEQDRVLVLLQGLDSVDKLKTLFQRELNYERANQPISTRDWDAASHDPLADDDDPLIFAAQEPDGDFHLIYIRLDSDRLPLTAERLVIERLLRVNTGGDQEAKAGDATHLLAEVVVDLHQSRLVAHRVDFADVLAALHKHAKNVTGTEIGKALLLLGHSIHDCGSLYCHSFTPPPLGVKNITACPCKHRYTATAC